VRGLFNNSVRGILLGSRQILKKGFGGTAGQKGSLMKLGPRKVPKKKHQVAAGERSFSLQREALGEIVNRCEDLRRSG